MPASSYEGLVLLASRFEGYLGEMRMTQLRKRETLRAAVDAALRSRGLDADQARLLADADVGALYIALDRWLQSENDVRVDAIAIDALADLRSDLDGIERAPSLSHTAGG
jgi:hypothetical protein